MIKKLPKSGGLVTKSIKLVIGLEVLALTASYAGWAYVNRDRDARFYLYKNHSWLLDKYYLVGEVLSKGDRLRQVDLEYWRAEKKI